MRKHFKPFRHQPRFLIFVFVLLWASCLEMRVRQDPFFASFYQKARLIMTEEELRIYKGLPDAESKEEFIEEFWKVRDTNPATEENEAKIEFEERIKYANMWFGAYNPRRGREFAEGEDQRTGWNEDRGRVYIILGPPDVIWFSDGSDEYASYNGSRDRVRAEQWTMEEWIYDRYRTYVFFSRTTGESWVIRSFDPQFFELLEFAKLNWIAGDYQGDWKKRFEFKPSFENEAIRVAIPIERISFDENFQARFGVRISVYRGRDKIDEIKETRDLAESKEVLLQKKEIELKFPYRPAQKGNYLFDIVIQDLFSSSFARYRSFVKKKF